MKKRIFTLLLALVMAFAIAACGKKDETPAAGTQRVSRVGAGRTSESPSITPDSVDSPDMLPTAVAVAPPEGKYYLTVYEMNGEDWMDILKLMGGDDYHPSSYYIEFQGGDTCILAIDYGPTESDFTLDGNMITVDMYGNDLEGEYDALSETITLELDDGDYALKFVFDKNADISYIPETTTDDGALTAAQEKWNGLWYGYMFAMDYFGYYEGDEDELYDSFMVIDIGDDGKGTLTICLGSTYGYYPYDYVSDLVFVEADIIADEYHIEVTEGQILDDYGNAPLVTENWWLGQSGLTDEPAIVIADTYTDADGDGFDYMFSFRMYGSRWEDMLGGGSANRLPPGYEEYIAELDGEAPDWEYSGEFPAGGDGLLDITYDEFKELLDEISNDSWFGDEDFTYDDVVEYLGGVEGRFDEEYESSIYYEWFAVNGGGAYVLFDVEDGELIFSGYSASEYTNP